MGNIFGAILTSFFTDTLNLPWYTAYALVGTFCTLFAIMNYFLAESHPEDVNVRIIELNDDLLEQEKYINSIPNTADAEQE
mmetsp:Transcript_36053/g.26788  ORF Transcript_36053/g.26788 Transcript_36053/m.26788 type:complete len:81 (-) Transcript_36053:611-853(-)|eukprot:CAMPEP_0202980050 /NCGR_PEP_ID=MMETSP1396-20130829/86043_1 /ASSEMBLY_ACC=CAM_ASM_000872 /TAXON_ID= /ORGANISM="Pseudokeronopsis sp., Strain Brazil" /LENGTH=80 /DNA_ID=CAMNT_0049719773 /DNA_START=524 /DNA_END=766 /DNA_ORIENTATION=-